MSMRGKASLLRSLPPHIVDLIDELIEEAAEDGYQNGYEAGYLAREEEFRD